MKEASLEFESSESSTFTHSPSNSPHHFPFKSSLSKTSRVKNPLTLFKSLKLGLKSSKGQEAKTPKKEYLRCKLIRGCKKCIRYLSQGKNPLKVVKFKKTSGKVKHLISKMITFHNENLETLKDFSKTDTKLSDETFKSYNSKFCSNFFKNQEVRKIFRFYVKLIFAEPEVQKLQKEFNFSCCLKKEHCEKCFRKWKVLKNYVLNEMIEEVIDFTLKNRCEKNEEGLRLGEEDDRERRDENVEKRIEDDEVVEGEVEQQEFDGFSVFEVLDLQPKWIQRLFLMDLHII
jgi:hypothetical protein